MTVCFECFTGGYGKMFWGVNACWGRDEETSVFLILIRDDGV
jgi:hypothetical protein